MLDILLSVFWVQLVVHQNLKKTLYDRYVTKWILGSFVN